jgi:dTDP-glucose 4,6-dehydratase/UDP-glucose 4-epimerase
VKPVLITGAAGFIGSALTGALRAAGTPVIPVDNLSVTSWRPQPDGLQIRDVRTLSTADLDQADTVVHLAAHKSVPHSFQQGPFEHNTAVDRHIVMTFAASRARRLLLASSCEVYGQQDGPLAEDRPLHPRSPYAVGKVATELLADVHRHLLDPGRQISIIRFFNTFGPYEGADAVVPAFLDAAADGRPLLIEGDGHQARDLTHIDDTLTMLTRILDHPQAPPVLNLGSGEATSVLCLAEAVIALTGRGTIGRTDPRTNEISAFTADMSRYETRYGPVPRRDLLTALADTRTRRNAARPQTTSVCS